MVILLTQFGRANIGFFFLNKDIKKHTLRSFTPPPVSLSALRH